MTKDKLYQVALSLIPNIGPVLSKQLLNYFESPERIFQAKKGKLSKIPGIGEKLSQIIPSEKEVLQKADEVIQKSEKANIAIHYFKEESYPSRLIPINDAPIVLYSKGNLDMNAQRQIGIVGTRKATPYGLEMTEKIVRESKASGSTIISGLAYGIDVKSHRQALDEELPTIGVLASGLDRVYPTRHRSVAEKMLENGGLVSEYPIGTIADPRFFPARNRIIAGLSDAVIVVEAARKGGALITGNIAFSYDKPVFAIPGDLSNTYSEGCNNLIRQLKAGIYTSFQDIIEALNWDLEDDREENRKNKYEALEGDQQRVIEVLLANNGQMHIDQLCWQSQIPISQMAAVLLELEFENLIKPIPGKEYRLS